MAQGDVETRSNRGQWENRLHDAMRRDGVTLLLRPRISVGHKKHYTVGEYLTQRYLYARSYAGARVAGASLPIRLAYGAAALALAGGLDVRIVLDVVTDDERGAMGAASAAADALAGAEGFDGGAVFQSDVVGARARVLVQGSKFKVQGW